MSNIIWLASYPKSGNTWLRVFLTNLKMNTDTPASINALDTGAAASRLLFDETAGLESSDLTPAEVDNILPAVLEDIARRAKHSLFFKTHDAYIFGSDGRPCIPNSATQCAIYLVRNPLDLAVSYAHHTGREIDGTITSMADEEAGFAQRPDRLHMRLRQPLLSWHSHVLSWLERPAFPVHVMRYEDMVKAPQITFTEAVRFIGLSDDPTQVQKAVQFSSFDELQRQEQSEGSWRSRPGPSHSFAPARSDLGVMY